MDDVLASKRFRGILVVVLSVLLALVMLGCTGILYPTFNHQGVLLDSSGNPVPDGNYTVMYRIYEASSGGTAVYTDTNTVAVTNGYFNSAFGASDTDPKIFSRQAWLELTVNGETLTPRQLLRGAPYASGLVAGSAAIGPEPITYTYSTYNNLGSALFVVNTDTSASGGSGMTGITSAENTTNRQDVAAVRGLSVDTDNDTNTGAYAGIFVSEDYRGIYADGGGTWFAAYFQGNINVTGSCTGCAMALTSQNAGSEALQPGDFVTAVSVSVDPDYDIPVLQVRKALAGDPILGVVESAMVRGEYKPNALTQMGFEIAAGSAEPGGYVLVATEGLVQARLTEEFKTGDFVTLEGTDSSFAQVMSAADEDGLTWVLLNR